MPANLVVLSPQSVRRDLVSAVAVIGASLAVCERCTWLGDYSPRVSRHVPSSHEAKYYLRTSSLILVPIPRVEEVVEGISARPAVHLTG